MDEQRKMLSELFGDQTITCCPYYICGFCPYELFTNSKLDMGHCDLVHSDDLKRQFEVASEHQNLESYIQAFESELIRFLRELDRKRSHERRHSAEEIPVADVETNPTTLAAIHQIQECQEQALNFSMQGDIDKANKYMERIDELKQQKFLVQAKYILDFGKSLKSSSSSSTAPASDRLRVCDICGALLAVNDTEIRLADHFGGKIHQGYLMIRNAIKELGERREKLRAEGKLEEPKPVVPASTPSGGTRKSRHGSRTPSRSRSRHHRSSHGHRRSSGRRSRSSSRSRSRRRSGKSGHRH